MNSKQKIIEALEDNPSGLSISDLSRETGLHRNTVSPRLKELVKEGELRYKKVGRAKVYYLSHDHILHGGMKMDKNKEKNVYAGVGISKNDDSYKAGKEAVEKAILEAGKAPKWGLVFCSESKYDVKDLVNGAHDAFMEANEDCKWAGCTTAGGELANFKVYTGACTVLALNSKYMQFGVGVGSNVHNDPIKAGQTAAEKAIQNLDIDSHVNPYLRYLAMKKKKPIDLIKQFPYFLMLFSPGHTLDSTGMEDTVVEGVNDIVGRQTPIIGGTAGDDVKMLTSYQFANGNVYEDAAIVSTISSGLNIGFAFGHGYNLTEKRFSVTDSEGYLVKGLDGKPAADTYAQAIGKTKSELLDPKSQLFDKMTPFAKLAARYFSTTMDPTKVPFRSITFTNPFGIVDLHGNLAVRIPVSITGDNLLFAERVPEGVTLDLLRIDPQNVYTAEKMAVENAAKDADSDPEVIFIFECTLRKFFVLGDEKVKEFLEYLKKKYPNSKMIGFYSMGEYTFSRNSEPMANSATVSVGTLSNKLIVE